MAKYQANISGVKILYVAMVLIVFLGLYVFYNSLESYIVEEDKGYQGEALTNDYLAAEFFLLSMGQRAEKIKLFSNNQTQLKSQDILLLPSARLSFDRRRSDEIIKWVKSGGHLIITGQVESEKYSDQRDHILTSIGLAIERKSLADTSEQSQYPVDIVSSDDDAFLQVDFDDYLMISKKTEFNSEILWVAEDSDRMHGIQIKLGDGKLTLLSDMRIFKNDYIDSYDHAGFLFGLAENKSPRGSAAQNVGIFYYSLFEDHLSLLQWLWENAYLLLVSVCLLIIIILWMIVPRFGPLIDVDLSVRRQFVNHLSAAGNYHWRQGNYNRLLADVRIKLSHEVKIKYPEWANLNKPDKIEHFSDISQLSAGQINTALFNVNIEHENDFITTMKLLEILRKHL